MKTGKLERALSIIHRLHLEKSFDIAIQASDKLGHRKLSDLIEDIKLERYPPVDDDDLFDGDNSIDSRERTDSYDEASVTSDRVEQVKVRGISPEIRTPMGRREAHDDSSEVTREESPRKASLKRKFEENVSTSTKRRNPFAKVSLQHSYNPYCIVWHFEHQLTLFKLTSENNGFSSQGHHENTTKPRKVNTVSAIYIQYQVSSEAEEWQANHVIETAYNVIPLSCC